jgi:maltose O-acetyltransferase
MGLNERARVFFARALGANIGKKSVLRKGQFITSFEHLNIGDRTTIGPFGRFFLFAELTIGDDVEIGSGLTVHTSEHLLDDPSKPLGKQGNRRAKVVISSDVYIGSNVTITTGSVIERRVVVAAGAVVSGTLKSGSIYGGVPAKPIKQLTTGPLEQTVN